MSNELSHPLAAIPDDYTIVASRGGGRLVLVDKPGEERCIIDRLRGITSRHLGHFVSYRDSVKLLDKIAEQTITNNL